MKRMLLVAAAFGAASVGLVAPAATAYTRNVAPAIVSAYCNPSTDMVSVTWDKSAGKPSVIGIFSATAGPENPVNIVKIPGSRGSKGFWNFGAGIDLGSFETYGIALSGPGGVSPITTCHEATA